MGSHLASLLRAARKSAGLSRRTLDERAGLTARSVERYEVREQQPDEDSLHRMAQALGLDVVRLRAAVAADVADAPVVEPPSLPLPAVLDALVERHGPAQLLTEAVAAAFRKRV